MQPPGNLFYKGMARVAGGVGANPMGNSVYNIIPPKACLAPPLDARVRIQLGMQSHCLATKVPCFFQKGFQVSIYLVKYLMGSLIIPSTFLLSCFDKIALIPENKLTSGTKKLAQLLVLKES